MGYGLGTVVYHVRVGWGVMGCSVMGYGPCLPCVVMVMGRSGTDYMHL